MPKYQILSYNEMNEYLNTLQENQHSLYPGDKCGFDVTKAQALETAKTEKATLSEDKWSIITHLTDWDTMYSSHPQLRSADTYSNDFEVMGSSSQMNSMIKSYYPRLADNIFGGKAFNVGRHNGIAYLYAMMRGIKEEKWAEMPEFAHYAKVLLRKCNLPLPVPRKEIPTRQQAEKDYIASIKGDEPTKENVNAMLGILAVQEKFGGEDEALIPYANHDDQSKLDKKMWAMFREEAHPVLTAAKTYELSRNAKLMEFLNTPDAVRAARQGNLRQVVQEQVLDPEAGARAKAEREEKERLLREQEAQKAAEAKAARGRAVQEKRRVELQGLLKRLGLTEADMAKKPEELKLSGSKEYNNMARAALEAYQSASGEGAYNIDLDERVRQACFAYTKGKKSVRTFESGRKRFAACLDLMMSVSEPDENGKLPEGVEAQFDRINTVRKTKPGDPNYVSPRYYKFNDNQITVQEALKSLINNERVYDYDNYKRERKWLNQERYRFIYDKLKESFPKLEDGRVDGKAYVDATTFRNNYGQQAPNPLEDAENAFYVRRNELKKQREEEEKRIQKQREEEEKRIQAQKDEWKKWSEQVLKEQEEKKQRIQNMTPEEREAYEATQKKWDKLAEQQEKDMRSKYQALYEEALKNARVEQDKAMEAERKQADMEESRREEKNNNTFGRLLHKGLLQMKQNAADAKEDAAYHTPEACELRQLEFDLQQQERKDTWQKDFFSLKSEREQVNYVQSAVRWDQDKIAAAYYHDYINRAWSAVGKEYLPAYREVEKLKSEGKQGKELESTPAYRTLNRFSEKKLDYGYQQLCRVFACTKLYKPNEYLNPNEVDKTAEKLYNNEDMKIALMKSITLDRESQLVSFNMNSDDFRKAQELFDKIIREPHITGSKITKLAPKQTLYARDVPQLLAEACKAATTQYMEAKKEYEQDEAARRVEENKKGWIFYKGKQPEKLIAARNMAIRTAIAGNLAPKLFTDPNAVPDMEKLIAATKEVTRGGAFMAEIVDKEIDGSLMEHIKKSCEASLQAKLGVEAAAQNVNEKSKNVSDAKPSANDGAQKKKSAKKL